MTNTKYAVLEIPYKNMEMLVNFYFEKDKCSRIELTGISASGSGFGNPVQPEDLLDFAKFLEVVHGSIDEARNKYNNGN
jgi:hypothetical protein